MQGEFVSITNNESSDWISSCEKLRMFYVFLDEGMFKTSSKSKKIVDNFRMEPNQILRAF